MNPYIKRLLIECPIALKTAFDVPDAHFETVNSVLYLRLPTDRGNYAEVKTYASGAGGWQRTFSTPVYSLRSYERGIDLRVVDERAWLYALVKAIAKNSIAPNLRTKRAIRVLDFVLPEVEDLVAAIAANPRYEPFTVRSGTLSEPKANGGSVGGVVDPTDARIVGGFSVKFQEAGLRLE